MLALSIRNTAGMLVSNEPLVLFRVAELWMPRKAPWTFWHRHYIRKEGFCALYNLGAY